VTDEQDEVTVVRALPERQPKQTLRIPVAVMAELAKDLDESAQEAEASS
jgi:hypothetical protein